jgi:hypothetical protein
VAFCRPSETTWILSEISRSSVEENFNAGFELGFNTPATAELAQLLAPGRAASNAIIMVEGSGIVRLEGDSEIS